MAPSDEGEGMVPDDESTHHKPCEIINYIRNMSCITLAKYVGILWHFPQSTEDD
jgi:hypothetical protein